MALHNTHQYLSSDPGQSRTVKFIRALFFAGVLLFAAWVAYFSLQTMTMPYQIEYREGASMVMTQILLKGENPFSAENQPLGFTNYGIGYSLLALPFAALFGNTLLVHRALTLVFLALTSALVARTVFKVNKSVPLAAACGLLVAIGLAGRGGLGALPNAMGTFLFIAALLIPFERAFDERSLVVSVLLGVIVLYTKPYFVLAFAIVVSYVFLFVSKRRGLRAAIFFALAFAVAFVVVRYTCKYYYIDVFISNLVDPKRSQAHVFEQLRLLTAEFYSGVLIGVVLLAAAVVGPGFGIPAPHLDLREWDKPLLSRPLDFLAYAFIVSLLAFIFILGLNRGNYLTYTYQLLVPTFSLWLFTALASLPRLALFSMPLLLLNMVSLCHILLNPSFLAQRHSPQWARLHQYVSNSHLVLNSPVIAAEMVELDMQPFDSGHTEFYFSVHPYPTSILLGPSYEALVQNGQTYMRAQHDRISTQEYDRLILTKEYKLLVPHSLVGRKYVLVTEIRIEMPQAYQWLTVEIWEPILD